VDHRHTDHGCARLGDIRIICGYAAVTAQPTEGPLGLRSGDVFMVVGAVLLLSAIAGLLPAIQTDRQAVATNLAPA
jgi:hypothetical protein